MEPTKDGFVHQSRQDEMFERLEAFVEGAVLLFMLTTRQRGLTPAENHLFLQALDLVS
jgi:hypothetical protein